MKKIGPLSADIVLSTYIHHNQITSGKKTVSFPTLVKDLAGVLSKSTISTLLITLDDWGIIQTQYGELESGRAGRLYSISGESKSLVASTYEKYWDKILEEVEKERKKQQEE